MNLYGYCANNPINSLDPLGLCPCNGVLGAIAGITANSVLGAVLTVGQAGPRITAAAWGLAGLVGSAYDYLNGGFATPPGASGPADAATEGVQNVTGQEGLVTPLSVLGEFNEQISQVGENANEVANQEAELTSQLIDNNVDILDNCF